MNILLAWNSQFLGEYGGMEMVCCRLANEMHSRGHHVTILFCAYKKGNPCIPLSTDIKLENLVDYLSIKKKNNIQSLPFIVYREILRIINKKRMYRLCVLHDIKKHATALKEILTKDCPDIIISFDAKTTTLIDKFNTKKMPLVTMCHFNAEHILSVTSTLEQEAIKKCTVVQVLIPHDIEVFQNTLPGIHLVRIPNIVPQYDIGGSERKPVIINVARLDGRQKRQHLLIDAFAKIADRFPEWTLEFWGEEQGKKRYTKRLKSIIQDYHLKNRIFLKGNTSDVEVIYRRGSIFGFPSAYEGFSLAMTEAMSAGIPAVAYRSCPAVNEIIRDGETGFLVDDGAEPLAEALARLMEDENLRRKMGAAAKEDMKQYAAETIWNQWETLMKRLIDENNKKTSLP